MTEEIRERSLKCVVAVSSARALEEIAALAEAAVDVSDRRMVGRDAMVVYSSATAAEIRDALMPLLDAGASLFVVEFERWSSNGMAVDAGWLLRRGH